MSSRRGDPIENKRRPFGHFNVIHHESGFKADIYPDAGDVRRHQWAFQYRRHIALGAASVWLAPPEYVIIRKLEYFREGGSEKHLEDIRKMLLQVESALDKAFLEKEIQARGLEQYWEQATKNEALPQTSNFIDGNQHRELEMKVEMTSIFNMLAIRWHR
ncbi:MAG: hypothetical protein IPK68_03930 [Bdellovibrionales bacterium]|nr:hypothetical protein [Bdellovibrionales bacterium]